jgi:hypothetical protein
MPYKYCVLNEPVKTELYYIAFSTFAMTITYFPDVNTIWHSVPLTLAWTPEHNTKWYGYPLPIYIIYKIHRAQQIHSSACPCEYKFKQKLKIFDFIINILSCPFFFYSLMLNSKWYPIYTYYTRHSILHVTYLTMVSWVVHSDYSSVGRCSFYCVEMFGK